MSELRTFVVNAAIPVLVLPLLVLLIVVITQILMLLVSTAVLVHFIV
ncbi:MAG TPA: hypothetical protein VII75_00175 [Thermoanaerobaculia bacterium]